jgi:hypothetical protein
VPLLALRASALTSAVALSCIRSCGTRSDLLYGVYVSLQHAAIIAESAELEIRPSVRPCTNRYLNRGSARPKVRSSRSAVDDVDKIAAPRLSSIGARKAWKEQSDIGGAGHGPAV